MVKRMTVEEIVEKLVAEYRLSLEIERQMLTNKKVWETFEDEIVEKHLGEWCVISNGKVQGFAKTMEDIGDLGLGEGIEHRYVFQVGKSTSRYRDVPFTYKLFQHMEGTRFFAEPIQICKAIFDFHAEKKGDSWKETPVDQLELKMFEVEDGLSSATTVLEQIRRSGDMVNMCLMIMQRLLEGARD
jgi:hypothetical protein